MNTESKDTLTTTITGVFTIGRAELEQLLCCIARATPAPSVTSPGMPVGDSKPDRMSYTAKETAELLGISKITVYKLLRRGLLRRSSALRAVIIPKTEIERFLKETTRAEW